MITTCKLCKIISTVDSKTAMGIIAALLDKSVTNVEVAETLTSDGYPISEASVRRHIKHLPKNVTMETSVLVEEAKHRTTKKILTLDIECGPSLAYVWSIWDQNIPLGMINEVGEVMCVAAKWYGEDKMRFFSNFHDSHDQMVEGIWRLLDEADIVVGYNHVPFDLKHLNREFALAEMIPPSPYKTIDLLRVVRQQFKFVSTKLQFVAPALGVGMKVANGGFSLWKRCLNDEPAAWEEFREYCEGDVTVTEALYTRLLPWIKNHPIVSPIEYDDEIVCPRCASTNISNVSGTIQAQKFEYPLMVCNDCGGHIQGKDGTRIANVRPV